ncbi:MAG: extracellular solute-binding protein [Acidimicrobiales bacterium]
MEYRVLGKMEARRDGEPVDLGSFRQRALLGLLLTNPNSVFSTDAIIDGLWGDDAGPDRQNALWVYVSGLRKALEPEREKRTDATVLLTRAPGYLVEADPMSIDAHRFEHMVTEGRLLADSDPSAASIVLGEALALWRGRAFEEFMYESWAQHEIARLDELRLGAVEARLDADLARGLSTELISELETLVREHPLREWLTGQLMLALNRAGRQAEALRAYQHLSARLGDELGIEPSSRLRILEEQIVTGDPSLELTEPIRVGSPEPGLAVRGYELREKIGDGAVGEAYRAFQPAVGREVVVTVVRPEIANDPDYIRRFEAEAQTVASLESPHLVPLYDYWREPDAAYLVTRLLPGGALAGILEQRALDAEEVHRLVGQLGDALAAAHRAHVIHREVTPETVLVDDEGNAYLYGLGRIAADDVSVGAGEDIRGLADVVTRALTGLTGEIEQIRGALPADARRVIDRAVSTDAAGYTEIGAFVRDMQQALLSTEPAAAAPDTELDNPFKGLRAFGATDVDDFHGRERLVERLVNRLGHITALGRFIAIVGPSGSGKSSVARAGLLPALRRGAAPLSESWFTVEMTPAPHPFEALEDALMSVAVDPPTSMLETLLAENGIHRTLDRILPADGSQLVLLVDQFEELFTQVEPAAAEQFLDALVMAVRADRSRLRVVVTLRADFYDRPLRHRGMGELLREGTEVITPMSPQELERAITGPIASSGVRFEPSLVAELVHDVIDRAGALPLLQYTLRELFDARDGSRITHDSYRELGGVSGALVARADGLLARLGSDASEVARQVFLRLVTMGEGTNDTRRRVLRRELEQLPGDRRILEGVLDTFGRHRLLSFDRDPVTRGPTVEISHEALLSEWSQLRQWIEASRHDVRNQRRLAQAMEEWQAAESSDEYLLRGGRLDQLHGWASITSLPLSNPEREFLDASVAERDRVEDEDRDREQRALDAEAAAQHRSRQLTVAGVAGVLVALLAVFGIWQWRSADDAREVAEVERQSADSERVAAEAAREDAEAARELAEAAQEESDSLVKAALLVTESEIQLTEDVELALLYAIEAVHATADLGFATDEAVDSVHWAIQEHGAQYDVGRSTPVAVRSGPRGLAGVYALPPADVVEFAETLVTRQLSDSECEGLLGAKCADHSALPADLERQFPETPYGLDPRVDGFYGLGGADGPLAGTRIRFASGPTAGDAGFAAELDRFTDVTGIEVDLVNTSDQDLINIATGQLDVPDVVASFARVPDWAVPRALDVEQVVDAEVIRADFGEHMIGLATFARGDGAATDRSAIRGLPVAADLKGMVFYPKAAFEEAGYETPQTWDELLELSDQIVADGRSPWCFGFESGFASGWPGTDLIESLVLRTAGPDTYVDWYEGEIPFTHPDVMAAARVADDLVFRPGYVADGVSTVSRQEWNRAIFTMLLRDPITDEPTPKCWMHHGSDALFRSVGSGDEVGVDLDFFMLPPIDPSVPTPVLGSAVFASGLVDRPEVRAFMSFLASPTWGEQWAAVPGGRFLPANRRFSLISFRCPEGEEPLCEVRRRMADIVRDAVRLDLYRFDASDRMPAAIGQFNESFEPGPFWRGMVDWVDGTRTIEQIFAEIDAEWAALRAAEGT